MNIKPKVDLQQFKPLNLFTTNIFSNFNSKNDLNNQNENIEQVYNTLLPYIIENETIANTPIRYVVNMDFYAENNFIKVNYLSKNQVLEKIINLENLIPVTESDVYSTISYNRKQENSVLDLETIYKNEIDEEFLIFLKDGEWNENNVNHEKLNIVNNYSEKKWLDYK